MSKATKAMPATLIVPKLGNIGNRIANRHVGDGADSPLKQTDHIPRKKHALSGITARDAETDALRDFVNLRQSTRARDVEGYRVDEAAPTANRLYTVRCRRFTVVRHPA